MLREYNFHLTDQQIYAFVKQQTQLDVQNSCSFVLHVLRRIVGTRLLLHDQIIFVKDLEVFSATGFQKKLNILFPKVTSSIRRTRMGGILLIIIII